MIRAEPSRVVQRIIRAYIGRQMKRHFSHFFLTNPFPAVPKESGLLIAPNHASWWDGFFIDLVGERSLRRQLYIMMLEEQLRKHWYFRRMGAFSIDPDSIRGVKESLEYTLTLISDPSAFVVLYPQGVLEPYDKRPLVLKKLGLTFLAERARSPFLVLPAAFKISFYNEKLPEIAARFAEPISSSELLQDFSLFEQLFQANLDALDRCTTQRDYGEDLL